MQTFIVIKTSEKFSQSEDTIIDQKNIKLNKSGKRK